MDALNSIRDHRHLQHQQRQPPAAEPSRLAGRAQTRRRLPAGVEGRSEKLPGGCARRRRLPCRLAGPAHLERRRYPRSRGRAHPDRAALPGDAADNQARYIEAAVNGVLIACIYAPNGNPQPGPKFDYKLAWLERLRLHANALRKTGAPVVLAGDYNVAPTEIDIYPTKSWDDNALVQPESRAAFKRLVGRSWTDALREKYPGSARLHILGLQASALAARRGTQARPFPALAARRRASRRGRHRPRRARPRRRLGPCAGVDQAALG